MAEVKERVAGFVGRCRSCKKGRREDIREVVTSTPERTRKAGMVYETTAHRYAYPGLGGFYSNPSKDRLRFHRVTCSCGASVNLERVQGVVNDHVCNAKCMSSTGHVCEFTLTAAAAQ